MMDYLDQGDLWNGGTPYQASQETLKIIAAQLLLAVRELHQKGYLHHDIKPHNLVRSGPRHIEMIDFGLACLIDQAGYGRGTSMTMAPEVGRIQGYADLPLHEGLDWWSVGATIYMINMLSTAPPDQRRPSSNFVPYRIIKEKPTRQQKEAKEKFINTMVFAPIPGHFSSELRSLLRILMNPNPNRRRLSTPYQFNLLKKHPYFRGIDWDTVGRRPELVHPVGILGIDHSIPTDSSFNAVSPTTSIGVNSNATLKSMVSPEVQGGSPKPEEASPKPEKALPATKVVPLQLDKSLLLQNASVVIRGSYPEETHIITSLSPPVAAAAAA